MKGHKAISAQALLDSGESGDCLVELRVRYLEASEIQNLPSAGEVLRPDEVCGVGHGIFDQDFGR